MTDDEIVEEYERRITKKGELSLPKAILENVGEKIIITFGPDESLLLFGLEQWCEMENLLLAGEPRLARALIGEAVEYHVRETGRLYISVVQRRKCLGIESGPVVLSRQAGKKYWRLHKA